MAKRITIGAPTLDMIMKYGTTDRQTIEDRINEENNAKEKGVQPTPSSATQGTYLNPSYGNVTQTPYTAPLQKSQTIGTPTPKAQPAKVDPVKAKLEKIGKPTLDQAQVTQGKTLEENLREAAYAAETKQQFIGAPATMPKTQEEQIAERQKELEHKRLMRQTQGTGVKAANIADPEVLYPAGKPLDPAIVQQGIKDNTLHLDETGGLHRANKGKWEPYPVAHSQRDGSFKPVELNNWTNAGGMAMHGTSSMYIPPTGVDKNSFNRKTTKAETFATGLLGTGARYFTGKSPDYPLGQQATGQYGEMLGDYATSIFAGTTMGGYFREASPVIQGIIQASVQNGVDFVQVENMVNKGYIDASQAIPLATIYGVGNLASPFVGRYILKTAQNNPAIKSFFGEQAVNAASVGGATYKMIIDNGGTSQQAAVESAKVAGLTIAAGMGFQLAARVPAFISNYLPSFEKRANWILDNNADMDGVSAIPYKPTGDAQLDSKLADIPKANGNMIVSNRDVVKIAKETPAQAEAIMSPEVKAGNAPEAPVEVKPTVPEPDIPTIKEIVTKINTDGLKPEGKFAKEWAAGFKDTELTAVKEGDTPTAEDKKSKITFARQAELAATMIFGEKVPVVKIFDMLNTDNLPISATIKDGFDNSVHDKIINGEPFSKADEFVGQVELKNVTDDVLNREKTVFPDNWLEKTIGMYSIAGSKKIEDALFDFYKNDTFAGTDGKAVPATLENILIDSDNRLRQAATNSQEMLSVENTPSEILTGHNTAKAEAIADTQKRNAEFADMTGATPQDIVEYKLENRQKLTPEELRIANEESFLPVGYKYDRNTNLQPSTTNMSTVSKPEALPTDNSAVTAPEMKVEPAAGTVDNPLPITIDDIAVGDYFDWKGSNRVAGYSGKVSKINPKTLVLESASWDNPVTFKVNKSDVDGYEFRIKKDDGLIYSSKAITEPTTPKPDESVVPKEDVPMTDDQLDAIAISEVAKAEPKAKKIKANTPDLTGMSTEEINNYFLTTNKAKWKKQFDIEEEYNPNITWDDFVADKIDEAYIGSMIRSNATNAGVGVALMLPELLSEDTDSDDPTQADMKMAMFAFGAAALGAGTVRYIKYRDVLKEKARLQKLGYHPEAPKKIVDSRAANNPELYYPGLTTSEVIDIGNKASKLQNAVIPKWYIFRNSDANIFLNTEAITRDHPQYAGIPWGGDPRKIYLAKQVALTENIPYNNMVVKAEATYKEKLREMPVSEFSYNQKAATIFRYNQFKQSDMRKAVHLPKSERAAAIENLNTPEANAARMRKAAPSFADGKKTLTDKQVAQLLAINPFFVQWQKGLQYNDIRLSCKQTLGIEYEKLPEAVADARRALTEAKKNRRVIADKINKLNADLTAETDPAKKKLIKTEIRVAKKEASANEQDIVTANGIIKAGKKYDELAKTDYVAIIPTAKKDSKHRIVINQVALDEETGKYKIVSPWDNNPLKLVGYAKTPKEAERMAQDAIIAAGTYKDPITGEIKYPQWQKNENVFALPNGTTVQYKIFDQDLMAKNMFKTRKAVDDMVLKILNNGTNGFDPKFVEGVASLRKEVLKQMDEVGDIGEGSDIDDAIKGEIEQNNSTLELLANIIADKDNIKFAENFVRKNLLQMLRPGILTNISRDYDPINYYTMSAQDITQGAFDVGKARTNNVESGLVNNAVANVAYDQLQWQSNMGIENNYTNFLRNKIDHNSGINEVINRHTMLAKWSSAGTAYLATMYLGINPISAIKNELAGSAAMLLTSFNYDASMAGGTYNLARGFAKNQAIALREVRNNFSLFNTKAVGDVADPFTEALPIEKIDNPFLSDPERLFNTNRPLSYYANDNPFSVTTTEGVPYKAIISDKDLYRMTSDAIHVSNIYNEDPISGSDIQGVWRGIGQVSFVGMKATEMHIRAFTAFTTADKILREQPYATSGYATPEEYVSHVVAVAAAVTEAAHGRYNLYDLAPFVRDIAGSWLGHNALLLMKPALQVSLNWVQAMRKTGIDIALADTPIEKRKIAFQSVGRVTALLGQMTLLGGVKAIPLVTELTGILATWNLTVNDGGWSATQQTAIEKIELKVRELWKEAGLEEWQIDALKETFYYGAFSTLVGANLSMNEGWASYFEPVTIKAMEKLFKDLGKAGKSDNLLESVGKVAYNNLVPNQMKRMILASIEIVEKHRVDKDWNEIGGKLTNRELITDFIAGKTLDETDDTESLYKFLNATDTESGKQQYLKKLIKSPGIEIKNDGYLKDFTDNSIAMSPKLLSRTKDIQIMAWKADEGMTEYQATSRGEIQAFIDADLALGDKSTLKAWAEYGKLPDEIKGGTLQAKIKSAMQWSDKYYQSEISLAILQNEAGKGNIKFGDRTISPSEITLDMPDAVKNAPDALKGYEYFKYKLSESMGKVERGGQTKPKKSGGKSNFNADGEYTEPKEYEYKEPQFNE